MYKNFTIKEANSVGKIFKVICDANFNYEKTLTIDKEYVVEITPKILPCSPLCSFINDKGIKSEAHLTRFTKICEID